MENDKKYWIAFTLVKGIGSVRFKRILSHFGDLSKAWQAPKEAFVEKNQVVSLLQDNSLITPIT